MPAVEEQELKGGHPPAMKAGGMRIARANNPSDQGESKSSPPKEDKAVTDGALAKNDKHNQQLLLSGVNPKGDLEVEPNAIKQYHEKHQPSREKHDRGPTSGHGKDIYLFQPR